MGLLQSRNRLIGGYTEEEAAFIQAVRNGNTAIVEQLLLDHPDIDVNAREEEFPEEIEWDPDNYELELELGGDENAFQDTALIIAIKDANITMVELLLAQSGIDVNARSMDLLDGWTALMWAVHSGNIAMVELLLAQSGIDVNAPNYSGGTPLMLAAGDGNAEIVEALIDNGADVNAETFRSGTALLNAVAPVFTSAGRMLSGAYTAVVELLLEAGADVNAANEQGNTPLWLAARRGDTAIVELLLEAGADANASNRHGVTALILAASRGHTAIVEKLLAAPGIVVNAKDKNGRTALISAARRGHTAVVRAIERFIAEQAMNRWIPRHRDRVGFGEFVRSTRVRDRLPRRAQTFIKGFL